MKYHFFILIFLAFFLKSICLFGFEDKQFSVVQMPSAGTLPRGFFWVNSFIYNGGGVGFNAAVGITDRITLGASAPIDHLVGRESPGWHIPSVLFKLRLLGGDPSSFHLSIGYGSEGFGETYYYYGEQAQGPFIAMRQGFFVSGLSQYFFLDFGVRYPVLPDFARDNYEASAYIALTFNLGQYFRIKAEVSHISFKWVRNPIGSVAFEYNFTESFSLALNFGFTGDDIGKFIFDRSLALNFTSILY